MSQQTPKGIHGDGKAVPAAASPPASPTYVVVGGALMCPVAGRVRELSVGSLVPVEVENAVLADALKRGLITAL